MTPARPESKHMPRTFKPPLKRKQEDIKMEKLIIKCTPMAARLAQQIIRNAIPWWPF